MDFSAVVLGLGPPIAHHLYTAWRRRKGKVDQQAQNLKELIARDFNNQLICIKIERDIQALSEHVVETLKPLFELDGSALTEDDLNVVVSALTDSIRAAGVSPDFLLQRRLDPLLVAKAYRDGVSDVQRGLSSKQTAFYDACIEEIARRLIAIADQLPGFNAAFVQSVLEGQGLILDQGRQIVSAITALSEANKKQTSYLIDNFDLRLRHAVKHRFGQVYVLGLDRDTGSPRLNLNTSYLSLRADGNTRRMGKRAGLTSDCDVSCDEILQYSTRVLIRGHAGSGKTTLLQWIATQCIDKAFLHPLHVYNDHAPLFIRLREYYATALPVGPALFATTSQALIELVPGDWFKDKLYRGRFIFLIDGLDEISEEQRRAVRTWLEDLIVASPQSVYIVTTRPSAIGTDYLKNLEFDEYFLKPMTPNELRTFVEYWHEAVCELYQHDGDTRAEVAAKERQLHRWCRTTAI